MAEVQDSTYLSAIKLFMKRVQRDFPNQDPELPFELVVGSLFPQAMNRVRDALTKSYIEGYNAGKADET